MEVIVAAVVAVGIMEVESLGLVVGCSQVICNLKVRIGKQIFVKDDVE
jgi:hypothetical protein